MKALLDTNVILNGALTTNSTSTKLASLKDKVCFIATQSIQDESYEVIRKHASNHVKTEACCYLIDSFFRNLNVLILPDKKISANRSKDEHVICAANDYNVDFAVTYNIKDIKGVKAKVVPPAKLLWEVNPRQYMVESPMPWKNQGMLIIGFRRYPDSVLGILLEEANGSFVFENENNNLQLSDLGYLLNDKSRAIPYGYSVNLALRMKPGGDGVEVEAFYWQGGEVKNQGLNPKLLFKSTWNPTPPIRVRLFYGKNYGFSGELYYCSAIPECREKNSTIRKSITLGTLDDTWGSETISELIQELKVEISGDYYFITLPGTTRPMRWVKVSK